MRQLDSSEVQRLGRCFGRALGVAFAVLAAATACSQAKFSGETPRHAETPPEPVAKALTLGCEARVHERLDVTGAAPVTVSVTGEVCLPRTGRATVVFVLDMSGSMGRHRPTGGGELVGGNDPLASAAGSCGRLAAVQAVVERLNRDAELVAADDVRIGLVPFAGDVLRDRVIAPMPLAEFRAEMTSERLCRYVVQGAASGVPGDDPDNPGGIEHPVGSATNYAAALDRTRELLAARPSGRTVYFISDGMPTAAPGGQDPAAAGIRAGERLRSLGSDVALNGLLLGTDGAAARDVMVQVAGAASRVRLAGKADELADEVLQFPSPELTPGSFVATLTGPDGSATPVELETLSPKQVSPGEADPEGPVVWVYRLADLLFSGEVGETSEHTLDLVARPAEAFGAGVAEVQSQLTLEIRRL